MPQYKVEEANYMASEFGTDMYSKYKINEGVKFMEQENIAQMYLNNTWHANMSITGADGFPPLATAGNVCRAGSHVRLSIRLPPSMDPSVASEAVIKKLTENVPYNAKVSVSGGHEGHGWCQKDYDEWLTAGIKQAGADFFDGKATGSYGMGGSIPFLALLEQIYPTTMIVGMGLIGPNSNAHAPDESINLPYAKKLTCSLSHIIAAIGK